MVHQSSESDAKMTDVSGISMQIAYLREDVRTASRLVIISIIMTQVSPEISLIKVLIALFLLWCVL